MDLFDDIGLHLADSAILTPAVMARDARASEIVVALETASAKVSDTAETQSDYRAAADACDDLARTATEAAALFRQLAERADADPRWQAHLGQEREDR